MKRCLLTLLFVVAMSQLTVHLKPSKQLAVMLSLVHCAVALLLWPLPVSSSVKLIVVLLLMISLYVYLRQDALLSFAHSAVSLRFSDKVDCSMETMSGQIIDCTVLGSTFVSTYLTVLILQPEHRWFARSVVIMPDAVDAEAFRRLRVLLRWRWKQNPDMDT